MVTLEIVVSSYRMAQGRECTVRVFCHVARESSNGRLCGICRGLTIFPAPSVVRAGVIPPSRNRCAEKWRNAEQRGYPRNFFVRTTACTRCHRSRPWNIARLCLARLPISLNPVVFLGLSGGAGAYSAGGPAAWGCGANGRLSVWPSKGFPRPSRSRCGG